MPDQDKPSAELNRVTPKNVVPTASSSSEKGNFAEHLLQSDLNGDASRHIRSFFLDNITNEFRTPLAALNASVEYLLGDLDVLTASEIRELLQSIHLSVTGLQTLIDNLIESTNIEAGNFSVRTGAIDIRAVVSESTRFTSPLTRRRRQQVVVEQPFSIPLVVGDPPRLTQVMVNLLSNASKLGPIDQTICVALEVSEPGWLRVTVAHQGSGMRPPSRGKIARRPIRTDRSGDRPYSVELGLSVAKAIVEDHGGLVGVEQLPDGGSLYWFTVPTIEQKTGG